MTVEQIKAELRSIFSSSPDGKHRRTDGTLIKPQPNTK